ERRGRQEDQRHQGRARGHQPRTERGEGPRRWRPQDREGGGVQGRGRGDQEEIRRGRRQDRSEVSATSPTIRSPIPARPPAPSPAARIASPSPSPRGLPSKGAFRKR